MLPVLASLLVRRAALRWPITWKGNQDRFAELHQTITVGDTVNMDGSPQFDPSAAAQPKRRWRWFALGALLVVVAMLATSPKYVEHRPQAQPLTIGGVVAGSADGPGRGTEHKPPIDRNAALAARALLDRRVSLDVDDAPLSDVLRMLSDQVGRPIEVDRAVLRLLYEATGKPHTDWSAADIHVHRSLSVRDIRLESALRLVLNRDALSAEVRGDAIHIGDSRNTPERLVATAYPIDDLLREANGTLNEQALADIVTGLVWPESWEDVGGPACAHASPGVLTIAQTPECHVEIASVLGAIRRLTASEETTPITFHEDASSPAVAAIHRALATPVTLHTDGMPLVEFLDGLAEQHQFNMVVDWPELWDYGIQATEHVSCHANQAPLGNVLRAVLRPHFVATQVENEALVVTTWLGCSRILEARLYPVDHLLSDRAGFNQHMLSLLIRNHIESESWDEVGGPASIEPVPGGLLVWQTRPVHDELVMLHSDLARFMDPEPFPPEAPATARDALFAAMEKLVSADWSDVPLEVALSDIMRQAGLRMFTFDPFDWDDPIFNARKTVTMRLSSVTARDALARLLTPLDAAAVVVDGTILITQRESATYLGHTRLYRFQAAADGAGTSDDAARLIQEYVAPQSWGAVGGLGSIDVIPGGLAVWQTEEVHAAIGRFLSELRRQASHSDGVGH